MDSRGHKCSQCSNIQYHYIPARIYPHRDIIGGFKTEEHSRGGHIPGSSAAAHPMSVLQGGVDI